MTDDSVSPTEGTEDEAHVHLGLSPDLSTGPSDVDGSGPQPAPIVSP
jgi:hypothetical protein